MTQVRNVSYTLNKMTAGYKTQKHDHKQQQTQETRNVGRIEKKGR